MINERLWSLENIDFSQKAREVEKEMDLKIMHIYDTFILPVQTYLRKTFKE